MKQLLRRVSGLCLAAAMVLSMTGGARAAAGTETVRVETVYDAEQGTLTATLSVEHLRFNVIQMLVHFDSTVLTPCSKDGAPTSEPAEMVKLLVPQAQDNWDYYPGSGLPMGSGWADVAELSKLEGEQLNLVFMVAAEARQEDWEPGVASDGFMPEQADSLTLLTLHFKVAEGAAVAEDSLTLDGDDNGNSILTRGKHVFSQGGSITDYGNNYSYAGKGQSLVNGAAFTLTNLSEKPAPDEPSKPDTSDEPNKPSTPGQTTGQGTGGEITTGNVPFTDISGHWAEQDILRAAEAGILQGYPDGRFGPGDAITRGALATMLARYYDLGAGSDTFTDVDGHWAQREIAAVCAAGLMKGVSASTFAPDQLVDRAQLATVFSRAEQLTAPATEELFTDDSILPAWAREGVYAARQAGIVNGYPDGRFAPEEPADRAQVSAILVRLMEKE